MNRIRAEAGPNGVENAAISFKIVSAQGPCAPGANVGAVWVRTALVELLRKTEVLKAWGPGSDFEKRVFELAAVFPFRAGSFDGEEFLRQIGEQR